MTAEEDRADPSSGATRSRTDLPLHSRLFEQLKQRNVFRVAALYLVVCWLILELSLSSAPTLPMECTKNGEALRLPVS